MCGPLISLSPPSPAIQTLAPESHIHTHTDHTLWVEQDISYNHYKPKNLQTNLSSCQHRVRKCYNNLPRKLNKKYSGSGRGACLWNAVAHNFLQPPHPQPQPQPTPDLSANGVRQISSHLVISEGTGLGVVYTSCFTQVLQPFPGSMSQHANGCVCVCVKFDFEDLSATFNIERSPPGFIEDVFFCSNTKKNIF